jgi:hypothetical protein
MRLAMSVIDVVNVPITRLANVLGDRVVLICGRSGEPSSPP